MSTFFYRAWQILWGLPQTVAGFVVFLAHIGSPHSSFHGAVVTDWPHASSVSLGMFVFVSNRAKGEHRQHLLVHEYGHTIQSLVLGPAYLLVVGLPSVIWGYLPRNQRKREANGISYYHFITERNANLLGELVCKEEAPR